MSFPKSTQQVIKGCFYVLILVQRISKFWVSSRGTKIFCVFRKVHEISWPKRPDSKFPSRSVEKKVEFKDQIKNYRKKEWPSYILRYGNGIHLKISQISPINKRSELIKLYFIFCWRQLKRILVWKIRMGHVTNTKIFHHIWCSGKNSLFINDWNP